MSKSLVSGRAFLEGPRWHDGVLYVSDMHGDAVLSVTEDGEVSTVVEVEQTERAGVAARRIADHLLDESPICDAL